MAARKRAADKDHSGSAICNAAAHGAGQRVEHHAILQYGVRIHQGAYCGLVVQAGVEAVFGSAQGEVAWRGAIAAHIVFGALGIEVHKHRAAGVGGLTVRS